MAVILTVTSTPSSFTAGNFPLSTLQSGPTYRFVATPTLISSNVAYNGFSALLATNDDGGLYMVNRRVELYNGAGGGTLVGNGNTLTWAAGATITITVNLAVGTNASSIVVSGAATGNGTTTFTATGTFFTSSTLGVGQFTNSNTFTWAGTIGNIDDGTSGSSASGTSACGGQTSTGSAIAGTFASGTSTCGGITSSGSAASPGVASGTSACGGITSSGSASTPAISSGTSACGGITSSGSAGQSPFGTQGASATCQTINATGPTTGTASTAFAARVASTAVAINTRLTNAGRRYHVATAGTTASGAGPSGTGVQADGTATLVAVNGGAATAPSVTTQTGNSVFLALFARGQWSTDTSAPTDNKGNTYTVLESNTYSGFPSSRSALAVVTNAAGGSGHTFGVSWGNIGGSGDEVTGLFVEVPTNRSTSFVQARSFVERSGPTGGVVVSNSVTTTGPATLVAFWFGTGNVIAQGTSHTATVEAAYTPYPDADSLIALQGNGYIQGKAAFRFVVDAGTYTATWTTTEGAHLYLVAIQEAPGTLASGTAACGGVTSAGSCTVTATVVASGTSVCGGISSAGAAITGTFALGSSACGGITSAGAAVASSAAFGTSACGGITSSGVASVAAAGISEMGGPTSSGSAIAGTFAAGESTCGGITSSGTASSPSTTSGTSACGGMTSSGSAIAGTFASGTSTYGGITSSGVALAPAVASGTSACGGMTSSGAASSPGSVIPRLPASLAISVVGVAPFRMDLL